MAAVRAYVDRKFVPWVRYAYGVGALTGLVVPRSLFWLRRRLGSSRPPLTARAA